MAEHGTSPPPHDSLDTDSTDSEVVINHPCSLHAVARETGQFSMIPPDVKNITMATLLAITQLQADFKQLSDRRTKHNLDPPPTPHHLNLPIFKGNGSINDFLDRYEAYAMVQGLTEQCKINLIFAQLQGKAAD